MVSQGDDKLWPERGEFYVDKRVEVLVCSWGLHTDQRPGRGAQGVTSPGSLPCANRDPPGWRTESQDLDNART